jgi:predicted DsbA family dithiol-disulfide isomerase
MVHRHRWSVDRFALDGVRPIVHQRCACRARRAVPAWDRSWIPAPAWRLVGEAGGALSGRFMRAQLIEDRPMADAIKVDVWSDVACPWCYIGKRHLEAGIAQYAAVAGRPPVEVEYHSFELAPDTPVDFDGSEIEYLMRIKGIGEAEAAEMLGRVTRVAADAGLAYDMESVKHTRTVKAHQVVHHAKSRGLQAEANERLLRAYFVEGRHIGRNEELADLAAEIGLDRKEVLRSLETEEHLDAVRDDQRQAFAYGIHGVPFFVLDSRYGLAGAQPPEAFAAALAQLADARMTADITS